MPDWLVNSFRKGYELKDVAIILECHKMWNNILITRKALGRES
jgi:hypothetical protein